MVDEVDLVERGKAADAERAVTPEQRQHPRKQAGLGHGFIADQSKVVRA